MGTKPKKPQHPGAADAIAAAEKAKAPEPKKEYGATPAIADAPNASKKPQNNLESNQAPAADQDPRPGTPRPEQPEKPAAPTHSPDGKPLTPPDENGLQFTAPTPSTDPKPPADIPVIKPPAEKERDKSPVAAFYSEHGFDVAYRMARTISKSDIIPKSYQGEENAANCLVAMEMANRLQVSPLMVMQNLYVVHGRPAWSAVYVIAALNSCGKFSPLRFQMESEDNGALIACTCWARELDTGDRLDGPKVTWEMVVQEGWNVDKAYRNGGGVQKSKWNTMREVMFRYRAASFFGKLYAPEIIMGMPTAEEIHDIKDIDGETLPADNDGQDQVADAINQGSD